MTLSGYVPELIEEDFLAVVTRALDQASLQVADIDNWCIHPGGKRILEAIEHSVNLPKKSLFHSYKILEQYGNMSSATILFVLKEMLHNNPRGKNIFASAFGPGLTVETFTATS